MRLTLEAVTAAVADNGTDAGITITTHLEPLGGAGAPVKAAGYRGQVAQVDRRWHDGQRVDAVVIDNVPSQANRMEASLEALREELGLPALVLDMGTVGSLPPHLPRSISSFLFPHRNGDAYLRDALLEGKPFKRSPIGLEILNATADEPTALFRWFPQSLLFGFWVSHAGNKRTQAKLSRAVTSEIVGIDPATPTERLTRVNGTKGDPYNLSVLEQARFDEADHLGTDWEMTDDKKEKARPGESKKALSEIGHGQVPFKVGQNEGALAPISFRTIVQRSTIAFAPLRRIVVGDPDQAARARALLVAMAVVAHVAAFGRSMHLRSGCDLRPVESDWLWLGSSKDDKVDAPSLDDARTLFSEAKAAAGAVLAGGGWDRPPLNLTPAENLRKAINSTWPLPPITAS